MLLGAQLWLWAALALVLAAAVFLLRWEAGRRRAGTAVARLSAQRRVVRARSRGQLELFRLRRELAELQSERNQAYQELGRATHAGDAHAARAATTHVDDVRARIEAKEAEIATLLAADEGAGTPGPGRDRAHGPARGPARACARPGAVSAARRGNPPEPAHVPEPFPEPFRSPLPAILRRSPSILPHPRRRAAALLAPRTPDRVGNAR